jgi:hypothetical protein
MLAWLPGVQLPAEVVPPSLPAPPANSRGRRNDYLPAGTTLERFIWVARFYAANGALLCKSLLCGRLVQRHPEFLLAAHRQQALVATVMLSGHRLLRAAGQPHPGGPNRLERPCGLGTPVGTPGAPIEAQAVLEMGFRRNVANGYMCLYRAPCVND